MSSSDSAADSRFRLSIKSDNGVRIILYSANGDRISDDDGDTSQLLPPGLYRAQLQRWGETREILVDHDRDTMLCDHGPSLTTPVPLASTGTSCAQYGEPAQTLCQSETCPPLGAPPHSAQLLVFIRRRAVDSEPASVPSEPVSVHDLRGRRLQELRYDTAEINASAGYAALSCRVQPGTYVVRTRWSQRDLAITIPAGRAARVFIADTGNVRLDNARISLTAQRTFDPLDPVSLAMEGVIAALRAPSARLPRDARLVLPDAASIDLCFGIAAAHLLWQCGDMATFDSALSRLLPYPQLPDVAILAGMRVLQRGDVPLALAQASRDALHELVLPWIGARPQRARAAFEAPPLLRASFVALMTTRELALPTIPSDSPLARAAATHQPGSPWCIWSDRAWERRWIEPTIDRLRAGDGARDAASIARATGLAEWTVQRTIASLDSKRPIIAEAAGTLDMPEIPGYVLDELLGRGERATVFKATRVADGRAVALKILPLNGEVQGKLIAQYLERVQRVHHPNLLSYDHRGVLPGATAMWFDMELCRGSVLELLAEPDARLSPERVRDIAAAALTGLAHLHDHGIPHGNIKPSNLLIRSDGTIALADIAPQSLLLGIPRPPSACFPRSIQFTSREAVILRSTSKGSDIWSIAATMYFLLTLDLPRDEYVDQSDVDVAVNNPVVPIELRNAHLPDDLAHCLANALSNISPLRPSSAAEFCAELAAPGESNVVFKRNDRPSIGARVKGLLGGTRPNRT